MKKIVYGFIALAAVFAGLTSCDDTNIDFPGGVDENVGPINIVVSTKGDDTRVYYQHDGTKECLDAEWQEGDNVLAISPNGTAYQLTVEDIEGDVAHIKGDAVRGVTVQLVYQKDISKAKWDKKGGLEVDFSEQSIDVDETGKYQIAPAVFAGPAAINEYGQGEGTLEYQCGIVKVPAVKGLPAGETITKISLWGTGIKKGKYSFDRSTGNIIYTPTSANIEADGYVPCDELVVNVTADDNLTYTSDANRTLSKEVFFAVPAGAILKQATVSTKDYYGYYFHNVYSLNDKSVLGQEISAKNYFTIDTLERYYFTVWDGTVDEDHPEPSSDARKIQIAKSNLYYDIAREKWLFEANPYDHRTHYAVTTNNVAVINGVQTVTEANTCGSFFWADKDRSSISWAETTPSYTTTDYEKNFFTNVSTFKVGEEPKGMWYTLSAKEWKYLYLGRTVLQKGNTGYRATCIWAHLPIEGGRTVSGYIFFHDNYLGMISDNMTYIPDGCVFLPAAGCRDGFEHIESGSDGSYWASNVTYQHVEAPMGSLLVFYNNGPNIDRLLLDKARSIRLVRNLPEESANPTTE